MTISNALNISKESKDATCLPKPYIIQTCDVSKSSTVLVDLFLRPPICAFGSRLCFSTRSWICLAMKDLMSFPIVLSKAISLYALSLLYKLLLGLWITAMQASLNLAR